MQGQAWVGLLQRIPAAQHDSITLMTTNGTEIVIQKLIRLDRDFVVALGRLAGSTEQGKVLILPYDQLTYLALNKQLTDAELDVTLGKYNKELVAEAPAATPQAATPHQEPKEESPPPPPSTPATPVPEAMPGDKPNGRPDHQAAPPSKGMLLARLRQRLADNVSKQPSH